MRIILLEIQGHQPLQVRVTHADRYERLRLHLKNYQEHEADKIDSAMPLVSLDELEKILGVRAGNSPRPPWYRAILGKSH